MKKGVENFKRRAFDEEEYTRLALEREDRERSGKRNVNEDKEDLVVETSFGKFLYANVNAAGPAGSKKAYLDIEKARSKLNLESKLGKSEKVEGGARQAGFRCDICDRVFQDSNSLFDHLNGREHQSRLGYSMHVPRSSADQVKSVLASYVENASNTVVEKRQKPVADSIELRVSQTESELQSIKDAIRYVSSFT